MFQTHSTPPMTLRPHAPDLPFWHLASTINPDVQHARPPRDVSRRSFAAMHAMFDDLIAVIARRSELFAGRAAGLEDQPGGTPHALIAAPAAQTEARNAGEDERQFFAIAADLQTFTEQVRESVDATARCGVPASAVLLSDVAQRIDQYLWIVESHAAQT